MKYWLQLRPGKLILLIVFLAILVRILYVLPLPLHFLRVDEEGWYNAGLRLLTQGVYGDFWKAPGYVFFLVFLFWCGLKNLLFIRLVQAIVGGVSVYLLFALTRRIFSSGIALLAATFLAVYPYAIYFTGTVLNETLLTFMLLLTTLVFFHTREKPAPSGLVGSGIVAGLTALVKPVVIPYAVLSFLWLGWGNTVTSPKVVFMNIVKRFLLVSLGFLLPLIPWTIRNYRHYGFLVMVSPAGEQLWLNNNPLAATLHKLPALDIAELPKTLYWWPENRHREIRQIPGRLEREKVYIAEVKQFIRENPWDFLGYLRWRFFHFWRLVPKIATGRDKIIAALSSGILLPLGWLGIILSLRRWRELLPYYFLFLTYTAVHLLFEPTIRYRTVIDPFLFPFAAFSLFWLKDYLRRVPMEKIGNFLKKGD